MVAHHVLQLIGHYGSHNPYQPTERRLAMPCNMRTNARVNPVCANNKIGLDFLAVLERYSGMVIGFYFNTQTFFIIAIRNISKTELFEKLVPGYITMDTEGGEAVDLLAAVEEATLNVPSVVGDE